MMCSRAASISWGSAISAACRVTVCLKLQLLACKYTTAKCWRIWLFASTCKLSPQQHTADAGCPNACSWTS